MKVILREYVYKHGVAGDVVDVADGFARNYLLPRGLAVKATKKALEDNENLLAEAAMRRDELNDRLVAVAKQIEGTHLVFGRKAGSNGKLYGSVTTMDIADALQDKTGIDINRRRISERSLREIGTFDIPIRMGQDLSPGIKVTVVREEDLIDYLTSLEGPAEDNVDSDVVLNPDGSINFDAMTGDDNLSEEEMAEIMALMGDVEDADEILAEVMKGDATEAETEAEVEAKDA